MRNELARGCCSAQGNCAKHLMLWKVCFSRRIKLPDRVVCATLAPLVPLARYRKMVDGPSMFRTLQTDVHTRRGDRRAAEIPPGQRVYAVGDIHGRRDLFEALVDGDRGRRRRGRAGETTVVLLGDLVDRGADSAGVIALARAWQARRRCASSRGNHEEMFLRSFDELEMFRHFLRHGGRDTVLSYGIDRATFATLSSRKRRS